MSNDAEEFDPKTWTVKELVKIHNSELEKVDGRLNTIEAKIDKLVQNENIRAAREEAFKKETKERLGKSTGIIGGIVVALELIFQAIKELYQ